MSSFNDLLKEVKNQPADYDLLTILNKFKVHPTIISHYEGLSLGQKDGIFKQLRMLSEVTDKKQRDEIFEKISKGYEKFFNWEEVTLPPCP